MKPPNPTTPVWTNRPDKDIAFFLAEDLVQIAELHDSERLRAMIEAALLQRAKETVALHAGETEFPERSLRRVGDPLVHWQVADISQSTRGCCVFGDVAPDICFPACGIGGDGGLGWEVATIDEVPVTCPRCLDLQNEIFHTTGMKEREKSTETKQSVKLRGKTKSLSQVVIKNAKNRPKRSR